MSSEIDPAKLKVVELRAELSSRGLDSKGIKAVLVKRLKDALEKELQQELPDTSIADTSTEDLNASQEESTETSEKKKDKLPDPKPPSEPKELKNEQSVCEDKENETTPEKVTEERTSGETIASSPPKPIEEKSEAVDEAETPKPKLVEEIKHPERKIEENGDNVKDRKDEEVEPRNKKSRWGAEEAVVEKEVEDKDGGEEEVADKELVETEPGDEERIDGEETKEDSSEMLVEECAEKKEDKPPSSEPGNEQRGDKRRRSSTSPTRSQRRRSRSPIKEDEPAIDNNKVQLNWYDSDLHLQIDKESFLSARPYHDGAFGYVWAGVRASHGANSGKVCFEVKITEELKWEDIIKQQERSRRDRDRRESRRERSDRKSDSKVDVKKREGKKSGHEESSGVDAKLAQTEIEQEPTDDKTVVPEEEIEKIDDEAETVKDEPENIVDNENIEMEDKQEEEKKDDGEKDDDGEKKDDGKYENDGEKKDDSIVEATKESEDAEKEEDEKMETDAPIADEKETMEVAETNVKDEKEKEVQLPTHLIRIGWSMINTDLQLGEVKHSYGYESSGKFFNYKQFSEYGKAFTVGDVIGAFVEFGAESVAITYTVNGEELPVAVELPRSELPEDCVLFPHVLSRNYAFEINLGNREEAWFPKPESLDDYIYIEQFEDKVSGPIRPENRSDCEIIMMCGLPASGKSHWLQEYVKENLEKRYTIIGNTQLLEKMTVNGNPLRNNIKGRWNVVLEKLSKCLNKLVEIAALRRRNYVIDQTNVFPSAQRRKMRPFEGFKRRAVIVVCGDEEQAKRQALQEAQDGKDVADIAVLEMKANMSLPRVGDWIEEVTYVELNEEDSKAMVQKYNKQGKDAGFGPFLQRRDNRDDKRWHNNRRTDYRGGYRERSYQNTRYERGSKHGGGGGGWQNRSQTSGWSRNDRRDSRGSSGGSRDWRNNNRGGSAPRHQDRGRDRDRSSHGSRDSYSRNRSQGSSRGQVGNWQGSGNWGGQGNWAAQGATWQQGQSGGGGGNWNQGWSQPQGQGQGKWNYNSQSYGQQGYTNYPNWNYYGQYQNWNAQGQQHQATGTNSGSTQAWAQYAQQYAQSNASNQHSSAQK